MGRDSSKNAGSERRHVADGSPDVARQSVEVALLPSPFLGAATWEPAAKVLRERGWSVIVCGLPERVASAEDVRRHLVAALPGDRALVLVPHSNAGLYVPALCRLRHVVASVFVDAALPPEKGTASLAPVTLLDLLESKADRDGLLPPWTEWWEPEDVGQLFPDEAARRAVEAEQPRVPLAYFHSLLEITGDWTDMPNAYLAFGDTYADERARAAGWGWPVATLAGQHLHMLMAPDDVADAVSRLLQDLGVRREVPPPP